jgi:hypothetical protein
MEQLHLAERSKPIGHFHQRLIDDAVAELKTAEEQERLNRIEEALANVDQPTRPRMHDS